MDEHYRWARVHRCGGGGGGDEGDRRGGLPIGVRGGAVNQGVLCDTSGAAAALHGDPGWFGWEEEKREKGKETEG